MEEQAFTYTNVLQYNIYTYFKIGFFFYFKFYIKVVRKFFYFENILNVVVDGEIATIFSFCAKTLQHIKIQLQE